MAAHAAPPTPDDTPRIAPVSVAAEKCQCSPRTIRRYIAEGRLTGYRFGPKLLRVDLAEVEALLRQIPTATAVDRAAAGGHR